MAIRTRSGTEVDVIGYDPKTGMVTIKMPLVNEPIPVDVEYLTSDNGPDEVTIAIAEIMEKAS